MIRKGQKPKNHMKENLLAIRDSARYNREAREAEQLRNSPGKDLYKLSQFRHVESRVYDVVSNVPLTERSENFLQKGSERIRRMELEKESKEARAQVERKIAEAREISDQPLGSPRKAPVPKEDGVFQHRNVDFVSSNKRASVLQRYNAPKSDRRQDGHGPQPSKHESFGRNPKYLEERKQQLREEQEIRRSNAPDPECPRGMKLMPEDERLSTLDSLQSSKAEVLRLLGKLPFVLDTVSSRKKQEVYESKLKEIENAIGIFKKPKVFIAEDA